MTLYHSSIEWFETNFRKPISKDLPSSYRQFQILTDLFVAHLDYAASTVAADYGDCIERAGTCRRAIIPFWLKLCLIMLFS